MKKVILVLVFVFVVINVYSLDNEYTRSTLIKLKIFSVSVNGIEEIMEEQIKNDVELKLRRLGLKVIEEERLNDELLMNGVENGGFIFIEIVSFLNSERTIYNYGISFEVHQPAVLLRYTHEDFTKLTSAQRLFRGTLVETWSIWGIGYVETQRASTIIRDTIKDYTDNFLNAYLSVNPK